MEQTVLDAENLRTSTGYYVDDTGYAWIGINGLQYLLHRYVMEQVLKRKLLPTEIVHHKDGDKLNNHPDNLEVTTNAKHSSEHTKDRKLSAETKAKIGSASRGRKHRPESIELMRQLALERERRKRNGKSNS